jgi:hypothetical protein
MKGLVLIYGSANIKPEAGGVGVCHTSLCNSPTGMTRIGPSRGSASRLRNGRSATGGQQAENEYDESDWFHRYDSMTMPRLFGLIGNTFFA